MQKFEVNKSDVFEEVFEINALIVPDDRGYVLKDYHIGVFAESGFEHRLSEVFYTKSKRGVVRAIHFQSVKPQGKLVRCVSGKVYDVVVDLRIDSPTYKKWQAYELSEENGKEIFIPHGFGHGYLVLEDSIVSYKCDEVFYGEFDNGIRWDDEDLAINWPTELIESVLLSEKDKLLQSCSDYEKSEKAFKL